MRDINEDLHKNPFDDELKEIATRFGALLREIVETIDTYGLKARHLSKHRKPAAKFIEHVVAMKCTTEAGLALKKRIEKNRDKLFTFLNYDSVPWNNNNAEHAVRAFARVRNVIFNSTPKGHRDYATLLAIQQTLRCRHAKSANSAIAKQRVSSWIGELQAAKTTSHGLPEDVLIHAPDGYGGEKLSWPQIRSYALKFYTHISAHVSDCTISRAFQRPIGTKKLPTAAVSIFRLMAAPLRRSETLFNASISTFVFRPSGVWFLTTTDPLYTTDHLHQQMLERAEKNYRSLSQAQDDLSTLADPE
jgi:hypothetical protein